MIKRAFLFLVTFSLSFTVLSQSKKEIKKNNVKSVKETNTTFIDGKEVTLDVSFQRYDDDGNLVEEVEYNDEGKVKSHNLYV